MPERGRSKGSAGGSISKQPRYGTDKSRWGSGGCKGHVGTETLQACGWAGALGRVWGQVAQSLGPFLPCSPPPLQLPQAPRLGSG